MKRVKRVKVNNYKNTAVKRKNVYNKHTHCF